jgi:hypothetical protein
MVRAARAAGLVTIGYAAFLGLWLRDNAMPQPSSPLPGWLALAVLFAIPGALALVGAIRHSNLLVLVAGLTCLMQSFVSFAGVTLPFLAPAAVLLWAAARSGAGTRVDLAGAGLAAVAWLLAWSVRLEPLDAGRDATGSGAILATLATIAIAAPLLVLRRPTAEPPR